MAGVFVARRRLRLALAPEVHQPVAPRVHAGEEPGQGPPRAAVEQRRRGGEVLPVPGASGLRP
ncbi:hypothetical protein [Streptomyces sp. NPDC055005]